MQERNATVHRAAPGVDVPRRDQPETGPRGRARGKPVMGLGHLVEATKKVHGKRIAAQRDAVEKGGQ